MQIYSLLLNNSLWLVRLLVLVTTNCWWFSCGQDLKTIPIIRRIKMAGIVFVKNCPSCGGVPDQPVGWTGKCPFCGRQLGHDSTTCMCEDCQDFRAGQMGIELLGSLKRMKANLAQQDLGSSKFCSQCGNPVTVTQNFCGNCGNKLR